MPSSSLCLPQAFDFQNTLAAAGNGEEDDNSSAEGDLLMTVNSVTTVMRRVLPVEVRVTGNVINAMQQSINDFIFLVTAEANKICRSEMRKTITPEDLISAMSKMGLKEYVEPLSAFVRRHREQKGNRGSESDAAMQLTSGAAPSGYPQDDAGSSGVAGFGYRGEGWGVYDRPSMGSP